MEFCVPLRHASEDNLEDLGLMVGPSWETELEKHTLFDLCDGVDWYYWGRFSTCLLLDLPDWEWFLPKDTDESPVALLVHADEAESAEVDVTMRCVKRLCWV